MTPPVDEPVAGPIARRARRGRRLRIAAAALAVAGLAAGGGVALLGSEAALRWGVERAVDASAGRLTIERPEGAIGGPIRAARVVWHDRGVTVSVERPSLEPSLAALLRGRLSLGEVSAAHVEVVTETVDPPPAPPGLPATLRLPVALDASVAIERLVVRRAGSDAPLRLDALRAAIGHDRDRWRIDDASVSGAFGRLVASATVGADAPFPVSASARLETTLLDGPTTIEASAAGRLEALDVQARGALRGASASASGRIEPFAAAPLATLSATLADLDLAAFREGAPSTALSISLDAERPPAARDAPRAPAGDARAPALPPLRGTLRLANARPGPIDAGRLPLESAESGVELAGDRVAFDGAALAGPPGRVTGRATVRLPADGGIPRDFELALSTDGLDLRRAVTTLRPTALRGSARIRPADGGLAFEAALSDGELSVDADARLVGRVLELARARVRLRDGVADLAGRVGLDAARRVELAGRLAGVDPARFAELPAGALNGEWRVSGSAGDRPDLRIDARLVDSRLRGLPLSGAAALRWTPRRVADVDVALRLGAGGATARGALGQPGDRLALAIDAPRLQELEPSLRGAANASVELRDALDDPGATLVASARELRVGERFAARGAQLRLELATLDALREALARAGLAEARPASRDAPRRGAPGARAAAGASPARDAAAIEASLALEAPRLDERRLDALRATLSGDAGRHAVALAAKGREPVLDAALRVEGGFAPGAAGRWAGRIVEATNATAPTLRLLEPATLSFDLDPPGASIAGLALQVDGDGGARARVESASWRDGRLLARGAVSGVPLRWLGAAAVERGLRIDAPDALRLGARIDVAGPPDRLEGRVDVFRESGDLALEAPTAEGGTELLRAGLQALQASVAFGGGRARAELELRGATVGTVRAQAQAPLRFGDAGLDTGAALAGRVEIDVPSLAFARALVGETWRLDGALRARLELAGTLGAPRASGRVTGTRLVAEQRELGMRLVDGELDATLAGDALEIGTLRFSSGQGSVRMSGALRADERSEAVLVLDRMPIPLGAGQRLSLSGEARATLRAGVLAVRGALRADEGVIELTGDDAPRLSRDVVVVRDPAEAARLRERRLRDGPARRAAEAAADGEARGRDDAGPDEAGKGFRIVSDLQIDLGERFRVFGSGVDARLAGRLVLRGRLPDAPRLVGTVRIVQGTYVGFGQKLEIERGTLVFSGPVDNPAIDIVALRRYLPVEAGVQLTGTARVPKLTLVSRPDVPEPDKLSWLVLGVPSETARGGGQTAALQTAAAALLATRNPGTAGPGIASTFGLDVLSIRSGQAGATGGEGVSAAASAQDSIVTLGKRLSQRLFVSYEQSLRGLQNLVRLQYEITERLSVRTRLGTQNGLDLLWTYRYD
ncbi:MAG TPA: translocation/assembly module TamB domain-containing protein [Burkholderiaceae bacterium]|nr:translocation/assembly module TamB domain-containing protein [Burkholderiaceae bacterium]